MVLILKKIVEVFSGDKCILCCIVLIQRNVFVLIILTSRQLLKILQSKKMWHFFQYTVDPTLNTYHYCIGRNCKKFYKAFFPMQCMLFDRFFFTIGVMKSLLVVILNTANWFEVCCLKLLISKNKNMFENIS